MTATVELLEVEIPGPAPLPGPPPERYVGLITRGIAFAIDAGLINLVALVVTVGAELIVSLLHFPHGLRTVVAAIGVAAYVLWAVGYFVGFWSATGQTPGNRVMQFRVTTLAGKTPGLRRGLIRCGGLLIAALPLFAGYALIPFDRRRRGLQDRIARTVVVEAPQLSVAQLRRSRLRRIPDRIAGPPDLT